MLKVKKVALEELESNQHLCRREVQAPPPASLCGFLHTPFRDTLPKLRSCFYSAPHAGAETGICSKELNTIEVPLGLETKQGLLLPLTLGLHAAKAPNNVWQIGEAASLSLYHIQLFCGKKSRYSASYF